MTIAAQPPFALPRLDRAAWRAILVGGAVATVAFDFFGQTLSPLLGGIVPTLGSKLAPVPLATQVIGVVGGIDAATANRLGLGYGLHMLAGLLAYPLGYALIVEPLAARVAPGLPWLAAAALYGVALWVFALFIMASLIAGNPPFLGFTGITWVALWGHVLFAIVAAWFWRQRDA